MTDEDLKGKNAEFTTPKANAERIMAMDKRPDQSPTDEQPDVFMRYVAQGMLEDLIAELQELV